MSQRGKPYGRYVPRQVRGEAQRRVGGAGKQVCAAGKRGKACQQRVGKSGAWAVVAPARACARAAAAAKGARAERSAVRAAAANVGKGGSKRAGGENRVAGAANQASVKTARRRNC